jgi:hypothetical protein
MKHLNKFYLFAGIFLASNALVSAQNVVDFEDLTLEPETFYDGGPESSLTEGETELFYYSCKGANFTVNKTLWSGGYLSWGGMAYSNTTDTTTASYTNLSAYCNPTGGSNSSDNYGVFYPSWGISDSVSFDNVVNLESVNITNLVWTYHYIMGTDVNGTGTFEADDSLTLKITAFNELNEAIGSVDIALADYTEGKSDIISNWTEIDLSSLENVKYIKFAMSSSDSYTPTYFCIDDLVYSTVTSSDEITNIQTEIYPNPFTDYIQIENAINTNIKLMDTQGRTIIEQTANSNQYRINVNELPSGLYIINIDNCGERIVKKLIK